MDKPLNMSTPPQSTRMYSPVPGTSRTSTRTRTVSAGVTPAASATRTNNDSPKVVAENVQRPGSASSTSSEDPDNTCAICLGRPSNKSFTDACYHPFCFTCLVEWSKVKATCPLCQKSFRTIVHNIKPNYEFDQYHIHQHYRQHGIPQTAIERRGIYELGYYARPNSFSRYRDTSPEFYASNPAQTHRLIPWLNRELVALLSSTHNIQLVMNLVLDMITRVDIRSNEMRNLLEVYLRPYTAHFQHELYCYASSPHDIQAYDRNSQYEYRPPLSYQEAVDRLRRTFERDSLHPPEVLNARLRSEGPEFSAFRPWSPQAGTSRPATTNSPQPSTSGTQANTNGPSTSQQKGPTYVIDSSSDDEEACQIVKVIRPNREPPVLIDLCDSDDTIPASTPPPERLQQSQSSGQTETRASWKRRRVAAEQSPSSDSSSPVERPRRVCRPRSVIGPPTTRQHRDDSNTEEADTEPTSNNSQRTRRKVKLSRSKRNRFKLERREKP